MTRCLPCRLARWTDMLKSKQAYKASHTYTRSQAYASVPLVYHAKPRLEYHRDWAQVCQPDRGQPVGNAIAADASAPPDLQTCPESQELRMDLHRL
eukprot:1306133-Amphidinium_carterae.1